MAHTRLAFQILPAAANLRYLQNRQSLGLVPAVLRCRNHALSNLLYQRAELSASYSTRSTFPNGPLPTARPDLNHGQQKPRRKRIPQQQRQPQRRQYYVTNAKMSRAEPHNASLPLAQRIPAGAWDSHMHILDPVNYPLSANAAYTPSTFSLEQALDFEASVNIQNIVIVQPSIYANDNSCLLDALRRLGPERGRGVVQFDPATTTAEELREWHRLGVRGVRLNIQSNEREIDAEELSGVLHQYADAVRDLNWVVQVYVPMPLITYLVPIVPTLNVRFCIDHIGHPVLNGSVASNPYDLAGFSSLVQLLQTTNTYVKLSAPYRISKVSDHSDLAPAAKELVGLFGTSRIVFATDWPHTRFEGLDIRPWMEMVLGWCGQDKLLIERLFKGNAEELWDVPKA